MNKKKYYQSSSNNNEVLPHAIYRKCVNDIRCYGTYKEVINSIIDLNEYKVNPCKIAIDKKVAEDKINEIESALLQIKKEYQKAVIEHIAYGIPYEKLEFKYNISISTMKRYVQKFVYLFAKEKGIDFINTRKVEKNDK